MISGSGCRPKCSLTCSSRILTCSSSAVITAMRDRGGIGEGEDLGLGELVAAQRRQDRRGPLGDGADRPTRVTQGGGGRHSSTNTAPSSGPRTRCSGPSGQPYDSNFRAVGLMGRPSGSRQ